MKIHAEKVDVRSIAELVPYARNSRTHSPAQIKQIEKSIQEFGWTVPVLVDEQGTIIAGHGRVMAASNLGIAAVPVVVAAGWTDDQKRAYIIADNKIASNADWDKELLALELSDLKSADYDLGITGFNPKELVQYVAASKDGLTDEDDVPEPLPVPVSASGDVWLCGAHRVMCGDSTDADNVAALLDGAKPNLMITDPPYGVKLDQSWRDKAMGEKSMGKSNANTVANDDRSDWSEVWALFGGDITYVWHASAFTDVVMQSLRTTGFEVKQQIIWNKNVLVMGRSYYHWKHEPCWYAVRKGADHRWLGDRKETTVWDGAIPNHIMSGSKDDKTNHPTQKPLMIYEKPIMNHTLVGEGIYEPFGGSGSCVIACEKLGRVSLTMELDPKYVDVIVTRWQAFTGKQAVLESSGKTFDELANARN